MTFPMSNRKVSREEGTRPPGGCSPQLQASPPNTHVISSRAGQSTKLAARGLAVWLSISHDTRLERRRGGMKASETGVPRPAIRAGGSRVARGWES